MVLAGRARVRPSQITRVRLKCFTREGFVFTRLCTLQANLFIKVKYCSIRKYCRKTYGYISNCYWLDSFSLSMFFIILYYMAWNSASLETYLKFKK